MRKHGRWIQRTVHDVIGSCASGRIQTQVIADSLGDLVVGACGISANAKSANDPAPKRSLCTAAVGTVSEPRQSPTHEKRTATKRHKITKEFGLQYDPS